MKIKWLGHSCFSITSNDGVVVLTDPYESGSFGGALKYRPIDVQANVVTMSHQHADHGNIKDLPGEPVVLRDPGDFVAEGVSFRGVSTFHDTSHGSERGSNVVFTFAVDTIKICHLGDLGHVLTADQAAAIGSVDVLLSPVGGYFTIGPDEAWQVADQLEARVVIPMHFKTPKVDFPIAPVEEFLKGKQNIRQLDTSEVELTKNTIAAEREIIVLQPAL